MIARDGKSVVVSIVSHRQGELVGRLLGDLERLGAETDLRVFLTVNIDDPVEIHPGDFRLDLRVIRNPRPKGFGENHNAAFRMSTGEFFCVLNPDIRLPEDPFGVLCEVLMEPGIGVVAPLVVDATGKVEDNARRIPTPLRIAGRIMGTCRGLDYDLTAGRVEPDWLAGMILLFRRETFRMTGGFDERYFLYCEDVDICTRIRLAGRKIVLEPAVRVVHDARRESHYRLRHMFQHVRSLSRFISSDVYRAAAQRGIR